MGMLELFVGWLLKRLENHFDDRPRLRFELLPTPKDECLPKEKRTKESNSDYRIQIWNIGKKPIILKQIALFNEEKMVTNCAPFTEPQLIEPFNSIIYQMDYQEADNIQWHCNRDFFECLNVKAYDIEDKTISGKLSVLEFKMEAMGRQALISLVHDGK